ncbi:hypothetical protein [Izhakiella australiensis]|uniref:hypothetical protein n=1 Tax=Izhakiella australiensis TaxID=1926881 RepID=UPI003BAE8738
MSHIVTRTDDGSEVFVTVDGKEAGELPSGEDKTIHLPPGEHQIGGYVPTLFGYGRVTIEPITVTTTGNDVKNIAYTVAREKPEFTEITQTEG